MPLTCTTLFILSYQYQMTTLNSDFAVLNFVISRAAGALSVHNCKETPHDCRFEGVENISQTIDSTGKV